MGVWQRVSALLDPSTTAAPREFTLGDRDRRPPEELAEVRRRLRETGESARAAVRRIDRLLGALRQTGQGGDLAPLGEVGDLAASLDENLACLRAFFRAPDNIDVKFREILLGLHPPVRAAVLYIDGLVDSARIHMAVLEPLMLLAHLDHDLRPPQPAGDPGPGAQDQAGTPPAGGQDGRTGTRPNGPEPWRPLLERVLFRLLPGNQVEEKPTIEGVIDGILSGDTVILLDGVPRAIVVETKGFPVRSVTTPKQEMVIRGPLDAFNESIRMNIALIRRRIKDPRLVTEMIPVGRISRTFVAVMYISGVVNPKLPGEIKRRVASLDLDYVGTEGILEQFVEDRPFALFPQTLSTERPDRAAAYLAEGHAVILADNSPFALVVPVTWWSLMQTAEDYYIRWPYGSLLRSLRVIALFLSVLTGGIYIATVNFHQEMFPTELLLAIAATRERVPFPAALELLFMEFFFELVREAGVRIPSVIGPTIGIVGALILGQALVAARIASPVVIIITAISGLASFAIPNYSTAWGVRVLRFVFIFLGMTLGLYGIALGIFGVTLHLAALRSFGVPYLSPVAPFRAGAGDTLRREPLFYMERRPRHVRPMDPWRQPEVSRRWRSGVAGPAARPGRRTQSPGSGSHGKGGTR